MDHLSYQLKKKDYGRQIDQRDLLTAYKIQLEIVMLILLISAKRCVEVKKSLLLDRYLEMPLSCRNVDLNQIGITICICTRFCELIIISSSQEKNCMIFCNLILKYSKIYKFLANQYL